MVLPVALLVSATPGHAVDATNWGSGVYSATLLPFATYSLSNVYHFDITLTLQSGDFITGPSALNDQADSTWPWIFSGMQWQPGGGNGNYFLTGSFAGHWWQTGGSLNVLPDGTWVHGAGTGYGVLGGGGKVGVTVDTAGSDITASSATEFSNGLLIWNTSGGPYDYETFVNFSVDIEVPMGLNSQNMQMGWTGINDDNGHYVRGQNSIDLTLGTPVHFPQGGPPPTPELPPLGLMMLMPMALGALRLRARRRR